MSLSRVLAVVVSVVAGCTGTAPIPTHPTATSSPFETAPAATPARVDASPTAPAATPVATASETPQAPVRGLVALGHSALTGEGSDPARPGEEARENSWATGRNPEVNSIYQRLVALRPETEGQVANAAEAGAPASRLAGQAGTALGFVPTPELVIIQTIDGDIRCDGTDDTHVPEFGAALMAALEVITGASPETRILILSQPGRPAGEAATLADEPEIRRAFGGTGMCDFFNPNGDLVPERLATLTGIIEKYEAEQARACSMFPQCSTDSGVMTTYVREKEHVVEGDWNHLGVRGQAAVAELAWPLVADLLELSEPTAVASPSTSPDDVGAGSAQRHTAHPAGETSAPLGYYEYLPLGYGDGDPRPLLVFVHGLGECGDGSLVQLDRLFVQGIPTIIQNNDWPDDRPFVVLAPQHDCAQEDEQYDQCGEGRHYGSCMLELQHRLGHPVDGSLCMTPTELYEFISYAVPAYDVDPRRVYLTGLSCGAYAAFEYAAEHGATQIAAMVPIAGDGRPAWEASRCELGQVAIWALHGDADYDIDPDGSIEPIENLMDCPEPPRLDAQVTVYPGVEHDSWTRTYDLSAGHDVYEWLLRFALPSPDE